MTRVQHYRRISVMLAMQLHTPLGYFRDLTDRELIQLCKELEDIAESHG